MGGQGLAGGARWLLLSRGEGKVAGGWANELGYLGEGLCQPPTTRARWFRGMSADFNPTDGGPEEC